MTHPIAMTLIFMFLICVHAQNGASAEVGQACDEPEMNCGAGELCVADGQGEGGRICTRRCSAVDPCPEPYECMPMGGANLCLLSPARAQAGESCAMMGCEAGLMCVEADQGLTCAQRCEGGGTCPRGFECRMGQEEAGFCLTEGALAPIGEPCDIRACAEGLSCIAPRGERSVYYCSEPCGHDEDCVTQMGCDVVEGICRHPTPTPREMGTDCLLEYVDELATGCGVGLICEPSAPYPLVRVMYRGQGWCTQECGPVDPCPEGYGCDYTQGREVPLSGVGVCQEGVIDAPALSSAQGPMGGASYVGDYLGQGQDGVEPLSPRQGAGGGGLGCERGASHETSCGLLILFATLMLYRARSVHRSQGRRSGPLSR